jgi:transglutaminase-like putative cysteine protease
MREYLESSQFIDWQESGIKTIAASLAEGKQNAVETAKACFEFVREKIKHSWDYRLDPVTIKASDVLKHGTGYCYAKSHLLAALLRANGIPAALCYQRLTITDVPPYCIHGLNAVFLQEYGWYRVDARGNKPGVHAEFMPPVERLAFGLVYPGECDIEGLYSSPHQVVLSLLESCDTVQSVFDRLSETDFTICGQ